jgi:hypothetical protein
MYTVIQRHVRLYLLAHDQQVPGNKGETAMPTATVVLALLTPVALVHMRVGRREVWQVYGVQPYHWLICDARGLHHAWYDTSSAHKNRKSIHTP